MLQSMLDWFQSVWDLMIDGFQWAFDLVTALLVSVADMAMDLIWGAFMLFLTWIVALLNVCSCGSFAVDFSSLWLAVPAGVVWFVTQSGFVAGFMVVLCAVSINLTIKVIRFVRGMVPL